MTDLVYETKKLRIRRAIDNLYNIDKEEAKLFKSSFDTIISTGSLEELEKLESEISEFNEYFKFLSRIDYLSGVVKNVQDSDKTDECVKVGLDLLDFYIDARSKKKSMNLDKLYLSIYELIKKEILYNNDSKIFDVIKDDEILCYEINKYVEKDIENIKNSVNEMKFTNEIKSKVSELSMNGISAHLVNYDLINLIVKSSHYNEMRDYYSKYVSDVNDELNKKLENANRINDNNYIDSNERKLTEAKEALDKLSTDMGIKFAALSLSGLLFGGAAFLVPKVSKSVSMTKYYETTTEIYVVGEERQEPLVNYQKKKSKEVSKVLEIGNEIDKDGDRWICKYDLTDILLDTIEEYANIDVDYYHLNGERYWTRNEYNIELMTEGKRRMTIVSQDWSKYDTRVKKVQNTIIIVASYIVMGCLLLFANKVSPLHHLLDLIVLLKENKDDKKKFDELLVEFVKALNETLPYVYEMDDLKKNYLNSVDDVKEFVSEKDIERIKGTLDRCTEFSDEHERMERLVRRYRG